MMKRALQKHVEDPVAETILGKTPQKGVALVIRFDKEKKETYCDVVEPQ